MCIGHSHSEKNGSEKMNMKQKNGSNKNESEEVL